MHIEIFPLEDDPEHFGYYIDAGFTRVREYGVPGSVGPQLMSYDEAVAAADAEAARLATLQE